MSDSRCTQNAARRLPFPSLPLVLLPIIFLLVAPVSAEPARLALVIGNSAYEGDSALRNPVNDAVDMAAALTRMGWQVSLVTDADRRGMNRSIAAWRDSLSAAAGASALFYYAGHGMQIEGANYLLPVKTGFDTVDDIKTDAIPINIVTEALEDAQVGVSLLILDACRDNPFARKMTRSLGGARGLSVVQSGGGSKGSAIMFSTSPGDVALDGQGRNGVFTAALLAHMETDLKLEDLFRRVTADVRSRSGETQKPWINVSLSADFYLLPEATRAAKAADAAKKAEEARQRELAAASQVAAATARAEEAAKAKAAMDEEAAKSGTILAAEAAKAEAARAEAEAAKKTAEEALALAARLQAEAANRPATGSTVPGKTILNLQSDPPGMRILVDGTKSIQTPASLEVEAGAHSIQPEQTFINGIIYARQQLQWITVPAGNEVRVPIKLNPEMAKLELRHVPPGYRLWVGGESLGTTPLGVVPVKAGTLSIRLEKPEMPTAYFNTSVEPGATAVAAFGGSANAHADIPFATIQLDGKKDSWNGIQPFFEGRLNGYGIFQDTRITRLFICRDDRYIYWRVDFEGTNPIRRLPRGVQKQVLLRMSIELDKDRSFFCGVIAETDGNEPHVYVYDNSKRGRSYDPRDQGTQRTSEDMVVIKIPYPSATAAFLDGPKKLGVFLQHRDSSYNEVAGSIYLPKIYVIF